MEKTKNPLKDLDGIQRQFLLTLVFNISGKHSIGTLKERYATMMKIQQRLQ
jgi:hypothetical protein